VLTFDGLLDLMHAVVYGDDSVLNYVLNDSTKDINFKNFSAQILESFGVVYTHYDKKQNDDVLWHKLDEVSFLKRKFRVDGVDVFAPLEKDVIYEMLNWVGTDLNTAVATEINADNAVREMFHYGRKAFNAFKTKLNRALIRAGIPKCRKSYDDLMRAYKGGRLAYDYIQLPLTGQGKVEHHSGFVAQGKFESYGNKMQPHMFPDTELLATMHTTCLDMLVGAPCIHSDQIVVVKITTGKVVLHWIAEYCSKVLGKDTHAELLNKIASGSSALANYVIMYQCSAKQACMFQRTWKARKSNVPLSLTYILKDNDPELISSKLKSMLISDNAFVVFKLLATPDFYSPELHPDKIDDLKAHAMFIHSFYDIFKKRDITDKFVCPMPADADPNKLVQMLMLSLEDAVYVPENEIRELIRKTAEEPNGFRIEEFHAQGLNELRPVRTIAKTRSHKRATRELIIKEIALDSDPNIYSIEFNLDRKGFVSRNVTSWQSNKGLSKVTFDTLWMKDVVFKHSSEGWKAQGLEQKLPFPPCPNIDPRIKTLIDRNIWLFQVVETELWNQSVAYMMMWAILLMLAVLAEWLDQRFEYITGPLKVMCISSMICIYFGYYKQIKNLKKDYDAYVKYMRMKRFYEDGCDRKYQEEELNEYLRMNSFRAQGNDEAVPSDGKMEIAETTEQSDSLTSFADSCAMQVSKGLKMSTAYSVHDDPYNGTTLRAEIERVYSDAWAWSSSSAQGALLKTYKFPEWIIANSSNVTNKLTNYRFFRGSVNVQIRVMGTDFHSGALMCVWRPHCNPTSLYPQNSSFTALAQMTAASCQNHVIASAASNTVVGFNIPWASNKPWYDLVNDYPDGNGHLGSIAIFVLAPLGMSASSSVPSVQVQMSFQFQNVQLAGPTFSALGGELYNGFVAQGKRGKEAQDMSSKGILSTAFGMVGDVATALIAIPQISGIASAVAPAAKALSGVARYFGYDKPTSIQAPRFMENINMDNPNYGVGMDMTQKLAIDPENAVSTEHTLFGTSENVMDFKVWKNKPQIVAYATITPPTNGEFMMVPVTPMYCYSFTNTQTFFVNTPSSFLGSNFMYWRGGMKYILQVFNSNNVAFSLRINYMADTLAGANNSLAGDVISRTYEVKGDTNIAFSVPYLAAYDKLYTMPCDVKSNQAQAGWLQFAVLSPMTYTATSSVSAYCVLWAACAEDMEFSFPSDSYNTYTWSAQGKEETPLCCSDIGMAFKSTFEPLAPATAVVKTNIYEGEVVSDWNTLLHRYSYAYSTPSNSLLGITFQGIIDLTGTGTFTIHRRFINAIAMWRGSVRWRVHSTGLYGPYRYYVTQSNTVSLSSGHKNSSGVAYPLYVCPPAPYSTFNGVLMQDQGKRDCLEVEVPYASQFLYQERKTLLINSYNDLIIPWISVSSATAMSSNEYFYYMLAFGDDFSAGWLCYMPYYYYTQNMQEEEHEPNDKSISVIVPKVKTPRPLR
jgi:hypothetical protein